MNHENYQSGVLICEFKELGVIENCQNCTGYEEEKDCYTLPNLSDVDAVERYELIRGS